MKIDYTSRPDIAVEGVPGDIIRAHLTTLEPYLAKFTNRGQVSVGDLVDEIEAGNRQCWVVRDHTVRAVALTQIFADRVKVCRITHLAGSGFLGWLDAFDEIEQWARHIGCDRIEAIARPEWERFGKRFGLRKTHVLLEKDLG